MKSSLTRQILAAHAATRGRAGDLAHERPLTVDHVVLDRPAAALVLAAVESNHQPPRAEILLVCLDRVAQHFGLERGDERGLAERARRLRRTRLAFRQRRRGCRLWRALRRARQAGVGGGAGDSLVRRARHGAAARDRDRDRRTSLGGGPLHLPRVPVVCLQLHGGLGPWVSGHDLVLEIGRRLLVAAPRRRRARALGRRRAYARDGGPMGHRRASAEPRSSGGRVSFRRDHAALPQGPAS